MITPVELELRTCNRCHREFPINAYHKDRTLRGGHRYTCKACAVEATRRSHRAKNAATDGLYGTLQSMKKRCYCRSHKSYLRYGGRGIEICDEWLAAPELFYRWAVSNGYRPGLQIDRIDNNGSYSPTNCRFVSPAANVRNRSCTKFTSDDIRKIKDLLHARVPQRQIARMFNTCSSTICNINRGNIWRDVS